MRNDFEQNISKLVEYVKESERIVFFGGAGVSTESGVPDFRSKDGLYNQKDIQFEDYEPEFLLSHQCLCHHQKVFYEFYRQKMDARMIQPNVTHEVLAKLEDMGKLSGIVTQNIDGLHQKAGSKKVYEIHGTTQKNYCMKCGKEYEPNYIFEDASEIPSCKVCGGQVRPDVVFYGESLPEEAVKKAQEIIRQSDMMIIAGTSLKVYPAASFIYGFQGKHLVVMNREKLSVQLNDTTDLSFECSMGKVFQRLQQELCKA